MASPDPAGPTPQHDFSIMIVAGEASGDQLASELVAQLQSQIQQQFGPNTRIHWFGAGGPKLKAAGVNLIADMTQWSAIGISDVAKRYFSLRRVFHQLIETAAVQKPSLVILVDYSHFNHKLARALKQRLAHSKSPPFIVKFVCPQVWASRPGRAKSFHHELNLLLCLFAFEKDWLAQHAPLLPVEWVGHPLLDRYPQYSNLPPSNFTSAPPAPASPPNLTLLPGSRDQELNRHLPVMINAVRIIRQSTPCQVTVVLPHERLRPLCNPWITPDLNISIQIGALAETLSHSTLAIASTGSVTLECALFRVPTIALYRTSWLTYQIGKRVVTVSHLAMPNILAGRTLFPEFIQDAATPEAIAHAALSWLQHPEQLAQTRIALNDVMKHLGNPGATSRAASAILRHWHPSPILEARHGTEERTA